MNRFRHLVFTAVLAGLCAGLLLTAVQRLQVVPLILKAERYESAATGGHGHDHHDHDHAAGWAPADGVERTAFTVLSNVLGGIAFALLLTAGMIWRNHRGWRRGLLWGLAGYGVFFLAPALGLPPEIPGTVSADLLQRQIWWWATVFLSAAGLALLAFARHRAVRFGGLLLLVIPHAIGAPHGGAYQGVAPEELADRFFLATLLANGLFWIGLGALTGLLLQRFPAIEDARNALDGI